jgi:hypothetical protein
MNAVLPFKDMAPLRFASRRGRAARVSAGLAALLGITAASAATFTVTTTADSGAGSLRKALLDANGARGADVITFDLAGAGPHTIQPVSPLPPVTDPVTIDGTTQPGYAGQPLIELDGAEAGAGANGLWIIAPNCAVRGLAVNRFDGHGLRLEGGGFSEVAGNFIGVQPDGTNAPGNGRGGVLVLDSGGNTLGGTDPEDGNLISGNGGPGVTLSGAGSLFNTVQGNRIGTDLAGGRALPNAASGVLLEGGATGNLIGGAGAGARNLISGNAGPGVEVNAAAANLVQANYIGTDLAGAAALPNGGAGVLLTNAPASIVGGADPTVRNVLSGNPVGVEVAGVGSTNNYIQGNFIGTDATGSNAVPNAAGLLLRDAPENLIGGSAPEVANLISGNSGEGIWLTGATARFNSLQGNLIGTDLSGRRALPNGGSGILATGAPDNLMGGFGPEARNIIAGNGAAGIRLAGSDATLNRVFGNFIGTDASGAAALPNAVGIDVDGAPLNAIGTDDPSTGNVISGNAQAGIRIRGLSATGNVVAANFIGADVTGTAALPNGQAGISLHQAPMNSIGGVDLASRNLISGNDGPGLEILGLGASNNVVQGNYIGPDITGTNGLGNRQDGILVEAPSTTIGGVEEGAGNVVSGNWVGIRLQGAAATGNVVQGNLVGTDAAGLEPLRTPRDKSAGILLVGAPANTIGGTELGAGNVVSGNGDVAIGLSGSGAVDNVIQGNLLGTDKLGLRAVPNAENGVHVGPGADRTLIGGTEVGAGNLISGNRDDGIELWSTGNQVLGNRIGTDITGACPLPNAGSGISVRTSDNWIGASDPGAGNRIAYNHADGVLVTDTSDSGQATSGNAVVGNAIYANGGFGINLLAAGEFWNTVTPNDPLDADTGPNGLQNFPVITNVTLSGTTALVRGTLDSTPDSGFSIDFYANAAPDPSGHGEGQTYLGFVTCLTDGNGRGSFLFAVSGVVSNQAIVATATDLDTGDTSEFSANVGGLRLLSVERSGADLQVRFTTWQGLNHRLEFSSTLGPTASWSAVPGASNVAGTGGAVTLTHEGAASGGNRFYRVRLVP